MTAIAQKEQRPLSDKMARKCEEAKGGICHCRCGGRFHGRSAGKVESGVVPFSYYNEDLPEDDPHWLPNEEQKDARKNETYEARKLQYKLKTAGKWHVYNDRCRAFEPVEITSDEAKARGGYVPEYAAGRRYFACKNCPQIEGIY